MTKLETLLKELCPDGVEYHSIKDVYKRLRGTPITAAKMKEIANDQGTIKIFAGGKTAINANESDIPNANITTVPAVLVQSRGIIDVIYYDKPFTFKNEMWAYTADNVTSVKFLYYVLKSRINTLREKASGMGSLPQISLHVTEDLRIPFPPLPIQREIVEILDNFSELTAELTAELTVELTARRKQYEYYRDRLLTFHNPFVMKRLGDIGELVRGNGLQKKDFTPSGVGCIHYGQIYTHYGTYADKTISFVSPETAKKLKVVEPRDLVITATSENVEDVLKCVTWLGKEPIVTGGHAIIFKHHENPKYLSYLFQTQSVFKQKQKMVTGVKVIDISPQKLAKLEVPIPPRDVQDRLVRVLDNFDTVCSDLHIGLPAEIEARKKQYEYYRDALLTFAERGPIIPDGTERNGTERNGTDDLIKLLQYVFGIVFVAIQDVADVMRGVRVVRKQLAEKGTAPVYQNSLEPLGYYEKANCSAETAFVISAGAAGEVGYSRVPFWAADDCIYFKCTKHLLSRYLYHVLVNHSDYLKRRVRKASVPRLSRTVIEHMVIPLPTLQMQKYIVGVLDHFDALVNDLEAGLPAEIEARKKQYEYYRDKLLSFPEKESGGAE